MKPFATFALIPLLAIAAGAQTNIIALYDAGTNGTAPRLLGLLPTFYDAGAPSTQDVDSVLAELHAGRVLQTRIALCDGLRAAPARRGTIFDCEPLSRAAFDYVSLIEEVRAAAA